MYCYSCGLILDDLPPTVCTSCGVHHWNDAKPTGIALVRHEGCLLLVRRAIDPWKGYWDCPGGFCNEAEHPITAAEREVLEETGIEVRVTGYVGAWYETHEDPELPKGLIKRTLGFFYHAVPAAGTEPKLSEETSEVRWFLPEDVPRQLAFPEQQLPAFDAWQKAMAEGSTTTPLPDRPPS